MNLKIFVKRQKSQKRYNVLSVLGQIEIGENFKETLYIPLDLWSIDDYQQQWQAGIERLKTHSDSCLIATIHDPFVRRYINWWTLYKIDKKVYIRNYLFVGEIYAEAIGDAVFNMQTCYDFIPPRIVNKRSSEWVVGYP